jgi:hypothetical protein
VTKTLDSLPAFAGTKGRGKDGEPISMFRDLRVEILESVALISVLEADQVHVDILS